MRPTLISLCGASRSGKGTCADVLQELAAERDLTFHERQWSGPGKQYLASAFHPDITEQDAIAWFERLKTLGTEIELSISVPEYATQVSIGLQGYMQRMLQGARDRWGTDFWTDKLLPMGQVPMAQEEFWWASFDVEPRIIPGTGGMISNVADVCVISDTRQDNEAERVLLCGGINIDVFRPVNEDAYRTDTTHITEQRLPLALVDYTIINDGSLEDLRSKARDLFTTILEDS